MDNSCGFFLCRPKCLQVFANIGTFTAVSSLTSLLTSTLQSYIGSQVPSIEKQFGLSSYQSGLLMSFNDIGFLVCCLFVTSLAKYVHIPRFLFVCFVVFGISGIICAFPHFFIPNEASVKTVDLANTTNSSAGVLRIASVELCSISDDRASNDTGCTRSDTQTLSSGNIQNVALGIIALGMILQGVGKAPRGPFTAVYIDDNCDKRKTGFYAGIISSIALLGSAIAFGVGGLFSKLYVTLENVDMSPKDPRWIGAWWLGFLVFGSATIICAFPMVCFPRRLRITDDAQTRAKLQHDDSLLKKDRILDRALSYVRIIKNPVFLMILVASCSQSLSFFGYLSFLSKYTTLQWGIPLWKASLVVSSSNLISLAIGTFIGGIVTRKIRMTPRKNFLGSFILFVFHTVTFSFGFFLGCDQPNIIGNLSTTNDINSTICSSSCRCQPLDFFPVCGTDGLTYQSPCYAGCNEMTKHGTEFQNCTCIPDGRAVAGMCDFNCNTLVPWAIMNFLSIFVGSMNVMFLFIAVLRCVKDKDKSTSTGLQSFMISLLAFIPGPILFGKIVDSTCILWPTCTTGSCLMYDIVDFRIKFHLYSLIFKLIAIAGTGGAAMLTWKWKQWKFSTDI